MYLYASLSNSLFTTLLEWQCDQIRRYFATLAKKFFGPFIDVLFRIWLHFDPTFGKYFILNGIFSLWVMAKNWTTNLVIWSHCLYPCPNLLPSTFHCNGFVLLHPKRFVRAWLGTFSIHFTGLVKWVQWSRKVGNILPTKSLKISN